MENFIDNLLESVFGGLNFQINLFTGVLLIGIGIILLVLSKKQPSKVKITVGWICIGIGCLGALSGFVQSLF
jgi:hypothetical protein